MNRIRIYREKIGLTQQELANKIGMSQETVSQYENGSRIPSVLIATKIADALGETLDAIFHAEDISK